MRYFRLILIVLVLSLTTYFLSLYMFLGLKIKGYSYLFYSTQPYDLVIKHAQILDGTGENERFRGDLAIRNGQIVGVGYVNPENSPVFDGGGLTIIPIPLPVEKNEEALEHALSTSYPRYPAQDIYLQEGRYQGLNLEQAAEVLGFSIDNAYKNLKTSPEINAIALIAEVPYREDTATLQEYLARLTGYRAAYYHHSGEGVVKDGAKADLYLFKNSEYKEEEIARLLKQGSIPTPLYTIKDGRFLNQ